MKIFTRILTEMNNVLKKFFSGDNDIISSDVKKIMANSQYRDDYLAAIERLRKKESKSETVRVSPNEEITITL